MKIIKGDIHDEIKKIDTDSINLIYSDVPFGITSNKKWDIPLRYDELWSDMWRILKDNGAVVIHTSMPFTFDLVATQRKYFKYFWIWKKNNSTNFFLAKKQPLRITEEICVFYKKQPVYNPQMIGNTLYKKRNVMYGGKDKYYVESKNKIITEGSHTGRYPTNFLEYNIRKSKKTDKNTASTRPDELVDFIIKTYTNENNTIFDLTSYDALTGRRAELLNREYIGVDLNPIID